MGFQRHPAQYTDTYKKKYWYARVFMIYMMNTGRCTSAIKTAVYENRTYGGVRGRRLVTASYSILGMENNPEILVVDLLLILVCMVNFAN